MWKSGKKRTIWQRHRRRLLPMTCHHPDTDGFLDVTKNVLVQFLKALGRRRRVRSRFTVEAVASSATEKQSGHLGPGGSVGFELFDQINVEDTAREAALVAMTLLGANLVPREKCQ